MGIDFLIPKLLSYNLPRSQLASSSSILSYSPYLDLLTFIAKLASIFFYYSLLCCKNSKHQAFNVGRGMTLKCEKPARWLGIFSPILSSLVKSHRNFFYSFFLCSPWFNSSYVCSRRWMFAFSASSFFVPGRGSLISVINISCFREILVPFLG